MNLHQNIFFLAACSTEIPYASSGIKHLSPDRQIFWALISLLWEYSCYVDPNGNWEHHTGIGRAQKEYSYWTMNLNPRWRRGAPWRGEKTAAHARWGEETDGIGEREEIDVVGREIRTIEGRENGGTGQMGRRDGWNWRYVRYWCSWEGDTWFFIAHSFEGIFISHWIDIRETWEIE